MNLLKNYRLVNTASKVIRTARIESNSHPFVGCGKTVPEKLIDFPGTVLETENAPRHHRQTRSRKKVESAQSSIKMAMGPPKLREDLKKSELLYNEYIVYDPKQVLIRYLVQVKFEYRK